MASSRHRLRDDACGPAPCAYGHSAHEEPTEFGVGGPGLGVRLRLRLRDEEVPRTIDLSVRGSPLRDAGYGGRRAGRGPARVRPNGQRPGHQSTRSRGLRWPHRSGRAPDPTQADQSCADSGGWLPRCGCRVASLVISTTAVMPVTAHMSADSILVTCRAAPVPRAAPATGASRRTTRRRRSRPPISAPRCRCR